MQVDITSYEKDSLKPLCRNRELLTGPWIENESAASHPETATRDHIESST
jgi:hypothetical protein